MSMSHVLNQNFDREGGACTERQFFHLKNAAIGWRAEQIRITKAYHRRGHGGEAARRFL